MTDFEDYESDTPEEACEECGDPLCPGCGPSVQSRLLKLVAIPLGIVIFALLFRALFLGGDGTRGDQVSLPSKDDVADTQDDVVDEITTSSITTTTIQVASPLPISGGSLTEDTIRSVVQVVQVDARGPCSWGSGTVVGNELTVLTNFHVIQKDSDCPSPRLEIWTSLYITLKTDPAGSTAMIVTVCPVTRPTTRTPGFSSCGLKTDRSQNSLLNHAPWVPQREIRYINSFSGDEAK